MSRAFTRVMALVTSTAWLLPAGSARGEPPSPAGMPGASSAGSEAAATPVDVVLVGRAGTEGSLAERIRSWFGAGAALSVKAEPELVAERVLGPLPTRRIAVWVTLRKPTEARLYFAVAGDTQAATRYMLRDVPLNNAFDEVGSERVAQVVHSSVTALAEGSIEVAERPEIERELVTAPPPPARVSPAPGAPPSPHAVPSPSKKESQGPSLGPLVGVFYRGSYAGDEGFAHGPGAVLGAMLGFGRFGAGASARGQYVLEHTERFDELDITLGGWNAKLGARGDFRVTTSLRLDAELGVGMFWAHYDPEPTIAGPAPAKRGVDGRFFEQLSLGASGAVGPVWLGGRLELEFYPVQSHYELESGKKIGSNARFQPGLAFEVLID